MDSELPHLNPAEARVLGCLAEKKELTPDVYPMTLNGLQSAVNQKTARDPVMELDQGEVLRALKLLQDKGLVRQVYGSRVERYEHLLAQSFSLTQPQIALVGLLLLRGPQTAHELLARSERLARFGSMESLDTELDLLIGRRPPLIKLLERAPGQREERYAHLLSGDVQTPVAVRAAPERAVSPGFESRLQALEEQVAALQAKLDALGRADR
ncbi:MAG: DUF480 domain-containing protein [Alphaproteobacteria bacterium]|nr:DUF480 domain-containing protein [Alphaproteobacteria bacterium]MBU0805242.1 DUF480 domain-containing protein [Alphaproteobacteria bacterium]MBU0870741.1 DUF480 domain-containing protein [Alphaproteobacteria bacterium]MBU1401584.1 DUF480 domain-containing protein [Alphaproteobacteria bacterium]MBU1591999.1 DUF480 domain-containing protein [Alphaproteobacteria bacterium]